MEIDEPQQKISTKCPGCGGVLRRTATVTKFGEVDHRITYQQCQVCKAKIWPDEGVTVLEDDFNELVVHQPAMMVRDDDIDEITLTWKL